MPDCAHSTPPAISDAQKSLMTVAAELRRLDRQLGVLRTRIPRSPGLLPDELRGVVQCVRGDLLRDAIETLEDAGRKTETEILRERIAVADVVERLQKAG